METLIAEDLVLMDTKVNLLKNKVVLIVPEDNTTINSFEDLSRSDVEKVGLGDPGSTPMGVYGTEIMTYYNVFEIVKEKLVLAKDVREVLSWVETKNADAGFVFATDAKIGKNIRIAATAPEESHKPAVYPAAILKNNENKEEAKVIFEKYGFTTIN